MNIKADGKPPVVGSGLPIHIADKNNSFTLCGLKVDKTNMSFHREYPMRRSVKNQDAFCEKCLSHFP
ncbi:hypothetical protein ACM44_12990 [Chryseobacterium koreense CCUG 49689]|uniref:Uncharacterized protein n=1 Tax=Chryseobacterium koreense CCUG 49689 TaxID=1304281 RepID=A0A0J7IVK4_9FLAO|nr:hypothetical protein ACM44_12990 [Chryseobacterium koreense CCUG 49689]